MRTAGVLNGWVRAAVRGEERQEVSEKWSVRSHINFFDGWLKQLRQNLPFN